MASLRPARLLYARIAAEVVALPRSSALCHEADIVEYSSSFKNCAT